MRHWFAEHEDGTALLIISWLIVAVVFWFWGYWYHHGRVAKQLQERPIRRWPDGKVVGYALHLGRYVIARASSTREILRKKEEAKEELL